MDRNDNQNGAAIVMVLVMLTISTIISAPLARLGSKAAVSANKWRDYDRAYLDAHSAMEEAKWGIYSHFESEFMAPPLAQSWFKFAWFDTWSSSQIGSSNPYNLPADKSYNYGTASVIITGVMAPNADERDVALTSTASLNGIVRQTTQIVRFSREKSRVFDYAYFINNFGWFWGNAISAQGDIRANGNFSFGSYKPLVNGDVYASLNAPIGATGSISGNNKFQDRDTYFNSAPLRARPGSPPSTNSAAQPWSMGYDGNSEQFAYEEVLEMPYLGDLSEYKWLANRQNGTITQGTNIVVDNVYTGAGPDSVYGNADDGTLILDGTVTPIEITGPVVIDGDVIIKGQVTGQGTIYAGRNVHIIGDVVATNPPSWTKPDTNAFNTVTNNADKDLIAFAAKGNVVIGNYRASYWNWIKQYMRPPFTSGYDTDPTDDPLGYDSDGIAANGSYFNGDYTAYDGGYQKGSSGDVARRFYEASISDSHFNSIAGSTRVKRVDAVLYNNHLICGAVGTSSAGMTFNGALVGRDEAIGYTGHLYVNWDIRLGSTSEDSAPIDIYLPYELAPPITVLWKEN